MTRQVLRTEIWRDQSDNLQYTVYCKTDLLNALCPIITRYRLPDIDSTLEEYRKGQRMTDASEPCVMGNTRRDSRYRSAIDKDDIIYAVTDNFGYFKSDFLDAVLGGPEGLSKKTDAFAKAG